MTKPDPVPETSPAAESDRDPPAKKERVFTCDRCRHEMYEKNCTATWNKSREAAYGFQTHPHQRGDDSP